MQGCPASLWTSGVNVAIETDKVTLCWPNRIDQASLSGGSWSGSLPLTNLQSRVIAKKARSTDAVNASTKFEIELDKGRPMLAIALAGHNLSADAQWRVRFYTDYAQTTLVWDSGTVDVWPAFFEYEQLEWEDNNFWFGNDTLDTASDYTSLATLFADDIYLNVRSIQVDILDADNASGYVEIGRCFVATGFQPVYNADYGLQFGHDTNTPVEEALDNTEYFDRKRVRRTVQFQLSELETNIAFGTLYPGQRDLGVDKELLFAYNTDSTDPVYYYRTFLGRMLRLDPLTQPYFERHSAPCMIRELL
jgi:hypothetical protein